MISNFCFGRSWGPICHNGLSSSILIKKKMFDPLINILIIPSILVTDDERPKKECSVRLSVELGPDTQLFLVVVDLLSLLRGHLDDWLREYIYR